MLHNETMIDVLYFGTPLVFMILLPLLIGYIVNSGELCFMLILTGGVLLLILLPVVSKIVDKYIMGNNMTDVMKIDIDKCPICNSENITYGTLELCDVGVYYNAVCNDCNTKFKEHYNLEFAGHEVNGEFKAV